MIMLVVINDHILLTIYNNNLKSKLATSCEVILVAVRRLFVGRLNLCHTDHGHV